MAVKKRNKRKENNMTKLLQDEAANKKKHEEKLKRKKEFRDERRDELLEKLKQVQLNLSGGSASKDGDADMGAKGKKYSGVIKTIGKDKRKIKANKALLLAAKKAGVIYDIKSAKQLLEGKKKREMRPNGLERTRDKKIRLRIEKRSRKGLGPKEDDDEEGDESSE
mmetsp:Transcript_66812/g.196113  ORF Transcript_66812/g.196113 Transcript_66812/m.196113 type:complete len:166 (+) Transcript_66812:55-552(+)